MLGILKGIPCLLNSDFAYCKQCCNPPSSVWRRAREYSVSITIKNVDCLKCLPLADIA